MRLLRRLLLALGTLLVGRRRRGRERTADEQIVEPAPPERAAETVVIALLLLAAVCAAAFIAFYAIDGLPSHTQLYGLSLGLSLAFLAAALILASRRLVPIEEREEEYPEPDHPDEQEAIEQIVRESGTRITRKRLLTGAAVAAGGTLGAAALAPALSLGPALDVDPLYRTPWRRGRRLVDEGGAPLRAGDVELKAFYTAFPEGASKDQMGAPLIVVRLDPDELELPAERRSWAPEGILAYSKICTHAGCAIALYRAPLFRPPEPRPAMVCPCHYSTFDPARAGKVLFGPAGRPLPQLPLLVDRRGGLRAAGNFSGPVGPSWWGVRSRKPRS
ncbi:MAG: ubiquinol-cytochrome c reductase iron-sulfur subunit [Thermoleophilaceae bacterium]